MSLQENQLSRAHTNINRVLEEVIVGRKDWPRTMRLVDLARKRSEEWLSEQMPRDGTRGGSSSPTELDERLEGQRLAHQVTLDVARIPELCEQVDKAMFELWRTVVRLSGVVDHANLPDLAGCRSCARKDAGANFSGVYEKAKKHGLCRWCYEYWKASGETELPPVHACELYHYRGPRAAGLWLAKQEAGAA